MQVNEKHLLKFTNCFAGSADRTVKFWDLETFELIGSARREVSRLSERKQLYSFMP